MDKRRIQKMTNKQPKALWMADCLDLDAQPVAWYREAAAELRRLHEVNAELVEALKDILSWEENEEMTWYPKARAALAKAAGEQQ
jgi:hypothetical protein